MTIQTKGSQPFTHSFTKFSLLDPDEAIELSVTKPAANNHVLLRFNKSNLKWAHQNRSVNQF